jgi:sugar phosphate isomerase/epimerase
VSGAAAVTWSGFADEAAPDLDGQIRATRALGWRAIEARTVDGRNLHDLPEADFEAAAAKLDAAGVAVDCFGSAIANWGKKITDPPDASLAETRRAIPRMRRLGTRFVRIMSYAVLKDRAPEDQMEEERFRRLREIVALFRGEGFVPLHENCMNYGGMGWRYTLRLLENVPGLQLVFDTGNPVFTEDYAKPPPRPRQSSWEFYAQVRDHVARVHIKDGRVGPDGKTVYTWPGDGDGDVRRVVADLLARGFAGAISIEPHLAVVFHDATVQSEADVRFANYVEYGRRMMRLVADRADGKRPDA